MNFQRLLAELDNVDDRAAEFTAAGIVDKVSAWAQANGYPDLVRRETPAADPHEVRKYLAECIAATKTAAGDGPYSVVQAAELLGVSKETVYREVSEGLMPHTKVRGRTTITAEQLAEYRERRAAKLPPGQFRHL
jgi:excisionase family DNA binding protein